MDYHNKNLHGKPDTEISLVLDNLCDALALTRLEKGNMSQTEYAAAIMDEYFSTPDGKQDMNELRDISYKINHSFSQAYAVLTDVIAPEIEMLSKKIDDQAAQYYIRKVGYQDQDGKYTNDAPKFKLLDVSALYNEYNASARQCALHLCKKYNYHVEYINDSNINQLLDNIQPTNNIKISEETIKKIFGETIVTVVSDNNSDVVINTTDPDSVKADDNVKVVDANAPAEKESTETDTQESNTDGANINVTTNDDASVTITVNDETVTTDPEEAEVMKLMIESLFSSEKFSQLQRKLFSIKGHVTGKNLTNCLYFLSNPLSKIVDTVVSKYLSPNGEKMVRMNLSKIDELQMGALIFLDVQSARFADKLIITDNLLNQNLVNKALEDGVDIYPLIRDHLRVYHNTNKDDIYYDKMQHLSIGSGVTYEQVLVSKYEVKQKLTDIKEETKQEYSQLLHDTRVMAFRQVLGDYIRDIATQSTEKQLKVHPNQRADFINRNRILMEQYINILSNRSTDANVEDLLYAFYFANWYGNTTVERLYQYTSEYIRQQLTGKTFDAKAIKSAKLTAMAELGSSVLFDAFM